MRSSAPVKPIGDISYYDIWVLRLTYSFMMKKGMATHSSVLAWRIPWTKAPSGLQSLGSQRVRHDWVTETQKFKNVDYVLLNYNICIHHICIHTYIYLAALASLVVAHGLNCPSTCGIFNDQGLNPGPWHWRVDASPLDHQVSSIQTSCILICIKWNMF